MLKIIVVDDEPLYRKYLIESVEWKSHGFEICCEAKNGLEALERIETFKPDIALVDINMPFMNGIELMEKIKEKYANVAVILVTGHSEFEYAQKAIRLGVLDYILKPFNNGELMVPLLRIKENIEKNRLERTAHKEESEMVKGRLLNLLISNEFILSDDEMLKQLNRLGINIQSLLFRTAIVEIDNLYERWSETSEIVLWQFALANILNEITNIKGKNIVFSGPEGRIISLVQFDKEEDWKVFDAVEYHRLCEVVKKYFDFTVTVGIGRPVRGFKAVRSSYKDAIVALQNKFIISNSKVIEYGSLESNGMKVGFYPIESNENLLMGLKMGDIGTIKEELTNIITFIKERRLSADYTMTIFAGLISLCLSYIADLGKSIEDVFGKNFSPYAEINSIRTLESSLIWFTQLFERVLDFLDKSKLTKSMLLVKKIKEYIDSNLQDNELDIERIAKNIFINSSYLRKTFKKETGITVGDYITSIRMQKAKELLTSQKDIAISRVSEVIGYCDVSYFSKCFKKYTGLSPSEYVNIKK